MQVAWQAEDPDNDRLGFALHFRGEGEREWKLLKSNLSETAFTVEADVLADGKYYFRVTASDLASNPASTAREAELISPQSWSTHAASGGGGAVRRSGARVEIDFDAADAASMLRRAEYSVDAGHGRRRGVRRILDSLKRGCWSGWRTWPPASTWWCCARMTRRRTPAWRSRIEIEAGPPCQPSPYGSRRRQDFLEQFTPEGLYHSFDLPDGARIDGYISLEALRERYARFHPGGPSGKRVLDIAPGRVVQLRSGAPRSLGHGRRLRGAGQFSRDSWQAGFQRRLPDPRRVRTSERRPGLLRLRVLPGVVYHLKHPLLGLEIVCALAKDTALVDSFVTTGTPGRSAPMRSPSWILRDRRAGGRLDNWHARRDLLLAMCRAAGFRAWNSVRRGTPCFGRLPSPVGTVRKARRRRRRD